MLQIQLRANVIKALAHPSRVLIAQALIEGEICHTRNRSPKHFRQLGKGSRMRRYL